MEIKANRRKGILAMLIVVLFVAVLITFPYTFNLTWALPSTDSDRTLTYSTGKLTWDTDAQIDENGVIKLGMFKSEYEDVKSNDGENIVAPGTENSTSIRLLNPSANEISYTAYLYRIDKTGVPIDASLTCGVEAKDYAVPSNIDANSLVSVRSGSVGKSSVSVIDVDWVWGYSKNTDGDVSDTALGIKSTTDEVEYGLYVVVTDNGSVIAPNTGDNSDMMLWCTILVVSVCVVSSFAVIGRRKKKTGK